MTRGAIESGPRTGARVTISDVAEALGLTKGTVSRALNGYSDIAETTRQRVAKQAKAMGYRPMAQAQAIRTGRTRSLGLVLQIDEHDGHRAFLTDFLAGVSGEASAEDWTLTVATANSDAEMVATMHRLVEEHKADGFILPRTRVRDPRIEALRANRVPFVLYGRTGDCDGCAWYDISGEDAMRDAVLRLAALGHRRIAFVNGGREYMYSRLRFKGFNEGLRAARLDRDSELVRAGAMTREDGRKAGEDLLALDDAPTGFVYAIDEAALGFYAAAKARGLRVGREVSVVSYDGVPEGALADPPLSTFQVDSRSAGARLASLLIRRIRGEAPEDLRELAAATFVARGSDRPPVPAAP